MLSLLLAVSTATPPDAAAWRPIRTLLENWQFTTEYAISIGTADHGQLFVYESGNFTMDQQIPTGSTSKWPSAMMFAGLVGDGTIRSLDDPVHEYLPYWTKHPLDARSQITLRHLLTFTSGFGDGHPGFEFNTRAARAWRAGRTPPRNNISRECDLESGDTAKCAQSIYSGVKLIGVPGHVYSYNSNHLQLAAGVAVAASGLTIKEVVRRYLLQPFGLTDSYYEGRCPDFAGSLVTTGRDYERFLQSLLSYRHPSPALILESERDGTPFLSDQYTLYGNYGFGHFLMCFDSAGGFTDACADARSHFDPGAFGFIPVLDSTAPGTDDRVWLTDE
mmetsp:Transcript_36264/g.113875  ORF Transcript_36264/g.113875 Transcript_36264/m.113875 type:complete len:333 (+) Transcript_36264:51-1049(+)